MPTVPFTLAAIQPLALGTAVLVLAAAVGAAAIGFGVLVRERASRESLLFFVFSLAVTAWFFPFFLMYLGPDLEWSSIWARFAYLGVPFIAPAGYQFGLAVARQPGPRLPMAILWGMGALFCVLALTTDLLVSGVQLHSWGPYPVYGPAGLPFVGFVVSALLLLVIRLWREARHAGDTVQRRRMQGITAAVAVAGIGIVDFAPKFGIGIYPIGFAAFFGFLAVSGWTIYRYRLVDYTPSLAADDVLETMADALVVTDPEGRIRLTNRAVEAVLGVPREDLAGRPLARVGAELAAGDVTLGELPERGEVIDCVLRIRTGAGELREVSVATSSLTDGAGTELGCIILLRDVTERRVLEEQLLQSQKLEALGRLAGGVAHDFNNLLTAMKGNTRFALNEIGKGSPARQELLILNQTLQRASRLTRQLLAFGRRGEGEPDVFRLGSVAREMEGMLGRFVGEDVRLKVRSSDLERPVQADRGQMEQVLLNLVVNAREAMPDGGAIRISVGPATLRGAGMSPQGPDLPDGAYTRLSVRDTGTGMSEETRRRIFEPFFSTKQRETGGGLGLATVYGIVTQAGGAVAVSSELGAGSTFDVYLPVVDAPEPAEIPEGHRAEGSARQREVTVLVVEDDPAVRRVMARALENAGYGVLTAANAQEALALAGTAPHIRALVTDAIMPGMTGMALLRELRGRGIGVPALLVSGYTREEIERLDEVPEGLALLGKPFHTPELVERVGRLVGLRRAARSRAVPAAGNPG